MKAAIIFALFIGLSLLVVPSRVNAQRDYFTPEEVELIREAQQIDQRIDVLTYAIDRRFAVLKLDVGGPKIPTKESEKWSEVPKGTRFEVLYDIKRILQKAIDDIDNLSDRPDSMVNDPNEKKPKGFTELFPKAVRSLAKAASRYRRVLKTELDKTTDNAEKGSILDSLDMCDQIIESVSKLK